MSALNRETELGITLIETCRLAVELLARADLTPGQRAEYEARLRDCGLVSLGLKGVAVDPPTRPRAQDPEVSGYALNARLAIAVYDTTGFSEGELSCLLGEVTAQAESSDPVSDDDTGHPDTTCSVLVIHVRDGGQKVVVHSNGSIEIAR